MIIWADPGIIGSARSWLNLTADKTKWLAVVPVGLLGLTFRDVRKVLFPDSDGKKRLQKWDQYWRLRVTAKVALVYAAVFAVLGLTSWVITDAAFEKYGIVLMLTAIVGSAITYVSVYLADLRINEEFLI